MLDERRAYKRRPCDSAHPLGGGDWYVEKPRSPATLGFEPGAADERTMMWFVMIGGTILYSVLGAGIDAVFPSAHLLGFNMQSLAFGSACMLAMVWVAARLRLFD